MKEKGILVFVLKFFAAFILLYALLLVFGIQAVEEAIAGIEAGFLGVQASGNEIILEGQAFVISESCTGIVSAILLTALVLSFKKPKIRKKILMIISGSLFLFFLNLARVFLVLQTAREFGVGIAEAVHVASWFAMVGIVVIVWYLLTKKMVKAREFKEMI